MKKVLGYIIATLSALAIVYIRFSNIDMSETRLLVEFWWAWALIVTGLILAALLITSEDK